MRNPAFARAIRLCALLLTAPAWAQAQSSDPSPPARPPEAGVPVAVPPAPLAAPVDPVAEAFAELDRDRDGKVSPAEHAQGAKARFDGLDADHNYHLSAAELERATASGNSLIGQLVAGTAATAGQANDDNDNGEISPEESRLQAEAEFLARDADRDGSLSLEELRRVAVPAARATTPAD